MQQQQHGDTLDLNMRAGVTHDASDVTEAGVDASDVHATTSANETATAAANAAAMYSQMTVGVALNPFTPHSSDSRYVSHLKHAHSPCRHSIQSAGH